MSFTAKYRESAAACVPASDSRTGLREGVVDVIPGHTLHHGGAIARMRVAWRLTAPGAIGDSRPIVAALGGISAHRRVCSDGAGVPGWWDSMAGPGRPIDSRRLRILGIDFVGGSGDSSGPSAGVPFPSISTYDQAAALAQVLDHLDVGALHAIVGASYGGMVALAFAERYPQRVGRIVVIGAADRSHPLATAWRSVQRGMVRFALAQGSGGAGLELARALAMATYRSGEEFAVRFGTPAGSVPGTRRDGRFVFPVEEYLFARGADYAARHRPETFLCLSESIDLHCVDAAAIRTPVTLVAVREDQLVPVSDVRALAARLGGPVQLHEISSPYGHDAFLKDAQLEPILSDSLASTRQ